MKTIKYYIFSLILALAIVSCDFLEKDPYELSPDHFYTSDPEVESALIGVFSPLMQEYFYGNNYAYSIAGGDDLSFYQRSTPIGGGSLLCADANSGTTDISNYWRILYDGINRANLLIEGLESDKSSAVSSALKTKALNEAKFMRAFYHFHLVQGWGSVPYRTKSVKTAQEAILAKTDKDEIYDMLIADMELAVPNLTDFQEAGSSAYLTKSAARGILARVYLFRAGEHFRDGKPASPNRRNYLEKAHYWAYEVIKSNIHTLVEDYKQVFIDYSSDEYNTKGNESIWEVVLAGNRTNTPEFAAGRIGNTIGFGSKRDYSSVASVSKLTGIKNPGYSYRFIYASLKLYELYDGEKDVVRKNWNIAPFEYIEQEDGDKLVTGKRYFKGLRPTSEPINPGVVEEEVNSPNLTRSSAKFRREYEVVVPKNKNYTPINFPILRYSDVLLMYAEAENELNGPSGALGYINEVRRRAQIGEYGTTLNQGEMVDAIKKERALELCFEGIRRWDLIRWGEYYTKMQEMIDYTTRTGWNKDHAYAAAYYKVSPAYVYFPIPDTERSSNTIAQNPGW